MKISTSHIACVVITAAIVSLASNVWQTSATATAAPPAVSPKFQPSKSGSFQLATIEAISKDTKTAATVRQWDYHFELPNQQGLLITVGNSGSQKHAFAVTYKDDKVLKCQRLRIGNIK
ncbi:MAG: hypothetical protein ABJZ55_20515 [Fuerstiella sp.]